MPIFEDKCTKIEVSVTSYPIKCDMLVLNKIQEKYGDIDRFRFKLSGLIPKLDENGKVMYTDDGKVANEGFGMPDTLAVTDCLYWFAQEGAEITGKPDIDRNTIIRSIDISPSELGMMLHEEYMRCLTQKNPRTTQDPSQTKEAQK